MKVELENDGPVTIEVNSPEVKPKEETKKEWTVIHKMFYLEFFGKLKFLKNFVFLENGGSYTISTDVFRHPQRLHYKSSGGLLGTI